MSLSDTSIKNPVFAWMLMAGIIVFGMLGFLRLGVSQLPDVDNPVLSISTAWEGAAPEVMETEVTDAIEGAVMGIQGVQEIISTSRQGSSDVTVQFDLSTDIDVALQEIQSSISRILHHMPREIDPPNIRKSNPEDQPILWLSVSGDRPLKFLMTYVRDNIKDQLTTIPGVGDVFLGGYVDPNLRVWLNADKMQKNELTVDDITSAILSEHAEVPAGYINTGTNEMNIRVTGEAGTVKEFSSIIIPSRKGSVLWKKFTIGDVADVEEGLADIRRISRTMGVANVGLGIRKQRGTNAVEVANAVKARVDAMQRYLPKGVKLEVRFDTTKFISDSIHEMNFIMILSVILTSLVCWLFLGSFNSAFNVFLTIPLSIFGTFFVIYILGFTLNTFTLLGLSLVIGIVVDDAIMMLENIARHREEGETKVLAAIKGARQITFAAIAATTAILAIFVPVIFMQGIIGKYFLQFGVTISVAVMISLLGALTLTPMFCAQFLTIGHTTGIGKVMDKFMAWLKMNYAVSLKWCLGRRWTVIFVSSLMFAASLFMFSIVKKEFVPPQDMGLLSARIETKVGSSIEFTDSVFKEVENAVMKHPEIKNYFSNIGGDMANTGNIMMRLKDVKDRPVDKKKGRPLTQQELMPLLRKELKAITGVVKASVSDPSLAVFGSRRGFPVEFTLNGPEWDKLGALSGKMLDVMENTGLMVDANSDYQIGMPEVRVVPDRKKAAERGVSISVIGATINSMIGGVRVGKYTQGGRRYDIRVQLLSSDRNKVADISKIWVRNNRGEVIRLSDVVSIIQKPSLLSITRKNRERAIRMYANVAPGKSQGEALKKIEELGKEVLPEGYRLVFTGSAQTYKDSFGSLYVALILGIFVAYMVLGTQFNSFVHPFTVLLALPFSISGAVIAMVLTGNTLNMYSAIGIILLMGIVKKNSILLVDFTNQRREEGMEVYDALMNACPIRLRPIIMTSISTVAAAVPPALAIGPGAETRVPMAVVVIGGVFVSTVLTLFVVPCVYSLMSKLESRAHYKDVHEAMKELSKA
ncbi:MAG: efflux RND transporter permease subunit [Elusimicrobia bacterium]|nr:efflux RND transporter permease subunit [Candidatus Liberimonas magnetica]